MPPRRRGLSETDKALWAEYARLIAPMPARRPAVAAAAKPPALPPVPAASPFPTPAASPSSSLPHRPLVAGKPPSPRGGASALSVGTQPGGLDSATWQRLRSGKLPALRKLDLHGMTTQRAFHALVGFLRTAHADQVRCVEVVTGRGSGENGGAIRREFPHWLNLPEIRPLVLGAAHPHVQNPGSVRLILRRIR